MLTVWGFQNVITYNFIVVSLITHFAVGHVTYGNLYDVEGSCIMGWVESQGWSLLPGHKGVSPRDGRGVKFKNGSDVMSMSHWHQVVDVVVGVTPQFFSHRVLCFIIVNLQQAGEIVKENVFLQSHV